MEITETRWRRRFVSRSSFPMEVRLHWRGVEVCLLCSSSQIPPTSTSVLTLFSVSSSRGEYPMGDLLIHYEVVLRALTKPVHEVEAISTT